MAEKWYLNYGEHVGRSHMPNNIPCQDKALCVSENGVTVAALSDGCGSAALSHYGSDATTRALCKLFTERFDELCDAEPLALRKIIIDSIIESLERVIDEKPEIFSALRDSDPERYENFAKKHGERMYYLDAMNATAIFVAEKDDRCILGQVGDGTIGAVVNGKLKIVMEEKKDGEVNATVYPTSINLYVKELGEEFYQAAAFQIKKLRSVEPVSAFILTTDGVVGFFDKTVSFQKKYTTGANKLFIATKELEGGEEARAVLNEQFLPLLIKYTDDDCGISVMVRPSFVPLGDDDYVITHYERPAPTVKETPAEEHKQTEPEPVAETVQPEPESVQPEPESVPEDEKAPSDTGDAPAEEPTGEKTEVREETPSVAFYELLLSREKTVADFIGAIAAAHVVSNIQKRAATDEKTLAAVELYITILGDIYGAAGRHVIELDRSNIVPFSTIVLADDDLVKTPTDSVNKYIVSRG